jgi:3-phenylpropionate/cinnamic acid dioxygenase small subunit
MSTRVDDELAIRRTLAAYCVLVDDGDFAAVAELFAPDGSFAYRGEVATGRDAIVHWFDENHPPERRGKHVCVNPLIDVDGGRATVVSDFLFLRFIDGTLTTKFVGRYRDAFVRVDGEWRIERRDIALLEAPSP